MCSLYTPFSTITVSPAFALTIAAVMEGIPDDGTLIIALANMEHGKKKPARIKNLYFVKTLIKYLFMVPSLFSFKQFNIQYVYLYSSYQTPYYDILIP